MLAIRDGRGPRARRAGRRLAGTETDLPLSSVGRLRARSGAAAEFRSSEFKVQITPGVHTVIYHGSHWHHRCFALRAPAWLLVCRAAKVCSSSRRLPPPTRWPPRKRRCATTSHSRRQRRLPAASPAAVPVFDTNVPEQLLVLTNARARYTFTSRGGGLKSVELLDYPETISPRWKKTATADGVATLNTRAPCRCWRFWAMPVWSVTAISP